jgi:hypothetical protein
MEYLRAQAFTTGPANWITALYGLLTMAGLVGTGILIGMYLTGG